MGFAFAAQGGDEHRSYCLEIFTMNKIDKESTKNRGKARKLVDQLFKRLEQPALDTTAQRFHASRRRAPSF